MDRFRSLRYVSGRTLVELEGITSETRSEGPGQHPESLARAGNVKMRYSAAIPLTSSMTPLLRLAA